MIGITIVLVGISCQLLGILFALNEIEKAIRERK